ncbi:hypothetical protein [Paraburkholderia domus]|nr:hypothetical protein [Paraburkholderia domus]MBK5051424.1 hypothetical protein [Burkholderia sp. R-70006]MBK5066455.1 hypothetical protein [Burkholderia sp. R-70199]MBK5088394.1 hypothetical protein [Burkholderia sp. R-69927]MBK5122791.1 hypothetical protein [Burkholderia sp. R-69980]MBK5165341.1 hypothetical protein [Burkholderia sp. R-70211]MBK5182798.1 hypothetical protein [Burkholderia sp. R-69749]
MEPYLFYGVVLPERAQLSLQFTLGFSHLVSGVKGEAKVSILFNQVAVRVESEHDWDIFDLRNVVKNIVQNHLAMVGYLMGYAYELEITRVLNQGREIDWVFGIDIPCLTERSEGINLQESLMKLRDKTIGTNGVFLNRCFADLVSSMKHADDTGFYCYRAIESLRHHCAAVHGLTDAGKPKQWEKFREVSGCTEETLRSIKSAADPLRHGEASGGTSEGRAKLLTDTWDVVDGYLNGV